METSIFPVLWRMLVCNINSLDHIKYNTTIYPVTIMSLLYKQHETPCIDEFIDTEHRLPER